MLSWPQDFPTNFQFLLRWFHFLAGITWIGMLYFFNLVNVPFQKELDAAVKGKVNLNLQPKALWWFRWGAVWTWVTGFTYWILILETRAGRDTSRSCSSSWAGAWPSRSSRASTGWRSRAGRSRTAACSRP